MLSKYLEGEHSKQDEQPVQRLEHYWGVQGTARKGLSIEHDDREAK